jgi:hypothetical protein
METVMKKLSQYMGDMNFGDNIVGENAMPEFEHKVSEPINISDSNPLIESYAKPASVTVKDDSGTVHSFAVEVKSSKNGPIPDTQLMSKILQAIEGSNTKDFSDGQEPTSFEVVSFKYERRDSKK